MARQACRQSLLEKAWSDHRALHDRKHATADGFFVGEKGTGHARHSGHRSGMVVHAADAIRRRTCRVDSSFFRFSTHRPVRILRCTGRMGIRTSLHAADRQHHPPAGSVAPRPPQIPPGSRRKALFAVAFYDPSGHRAGSVPKAIFSTAGIHRGNVGRADASKNPLWQ